MDHGVLLWNLCGFLLR